jgi:hypothetical protein
LVFNWPLFDIFWPIFLLSLALIIRPLSQNHLLIEDIYVRKSNKVVFSNPNTIYYLIGTLLLIRVVGTFFTIDF